MLRRVFIQILLLITVAVVIGLILKNIGISLWYGILIGALLQYAIYNGFIFALNAYVTLRNKQLENERIKEFSLQGLEVTCPCPLKKVEFIPITLNAENIYKCDHCLKNVSVYINPETALVTETLASASVDTIIEQKLLEQKK